MAMKNRVVLPTAPILPPSPKRVKLDPSFKVITKPPGVCPVPSGVKTEFPIKSLDDFYKPCPTYRLPVELGAFSLDSQGDLKLDRTQLRYFILPAHPTRPNFDLNIGFSQFVPKKDNVPSNKLNPILRWINENGDYFRPRSQPLSPPITGEGVKSNIFSPPSLSEGQKSKVSESQTVPENVVEGRKGSSSDNHESVTSPSKERCVCDLCLVKVVC